MKVKTWSTDGDPEVIAKGYGRVFLRQWYINPENNERTDFTLFGTVKNLWPTIILPVTDDLKVVALRQFRPGPNEIVLEIPGGNPDPRQGDTSPAIVGRRELIEETGYEPQEVIQLSDKAFLDPASYKVSYYPCLALGCRHNNKQSLDKNEQVELVTFTLKDWLSMTFSGQVKDSKTVLTTHLALPYILGVNYRDLVQKLLS